VRLVYRAGMSVLDLRSLSRSHPRESNPPSGILLNACRASLISIGKI
jgi:hypothetical protein